MIEGAKKVAKLLLPRWLCVRRLRLEAGDAVLLTFDDGPHPRTTPAVLDRLKAYGARAVFFVVGNRIHRAPKMLNRIIGEGHFLGNHTYAHPADRRMRYREYLNDLARCQEEVFQLTGSRPRFHRPPMGELSLASLLAPRRLGLTTLIWSYSAEDWRFRSDDVAVARADEMAADVTARDIVLFHDERPHMLLTLDRLLPILKSRGLNLAPRLKDMV
jgi:peptidoglycan/xylan/chitin deacetylase (PgdA/CDA1 family)